MYSQYPQTFRMSLSGKKLGAEESWKQMHFQLPHYNKCCIMSRNANPMRLTLWVAYVYDLIVTM